MQSLIGISLVFHVLIFMHIAGVYRSGEMTYIELTLQDVSKPFQRSIPRPRLQRNTPKIHDVKNYNIKKQHIPLIKIDSKEVDFSDNIMEDISMPDIPANTTLDISDLNFSGNENFVTKNDYFEIVRIKIKSRKKYPESAKNKHMEGRVKVRFVITADGQLSSLKIIKHSRHNSLDRAALNAVKDASPFPCPPSGLFAAPLSIKLSIVFELM